uniref:Trithorax group protein osa n=1 Tax=Cacopsylla melanoneura TaxID=428564 RepID=A0A8D8PVJ6_9HEMI
MAATQAEPPVPESSGGPESGPGPDMEHGGPPPQGLQNGEKNNKPLPPPSGPPEHNVGPKGKMQNNVGMDPMNQYRPEPPGGPPGMNNNNNEAPLHNDESGPPQGDKMYPPHPGQQEGGPPMGHPGYPGGGPNYPHTPPRGGYHHGGGEMDQMNQQMRHGGGYKPMPPRGAMGPGPMQGGYPQQRFISGQSISQPTGPTPTLNQLLQSSNPGAHRFQNRYGPGPGEPYAQNWPPPRGPMPPQSYPNQQGPTPGGPTPTPGHNMGGPGVYRNQQPPNRYPSNAGEPPTPASPTQGGYPQRYHTPPSRPAYPYPTQPGQNYDPSQQQRQWNQTSHPHPPQSQSPGQSPSPQSPRPTQDPPDNDRPTPSPTGSTGSRSVSPAVVGGNYGGVGVRPPYGGYNTQGGPGSAQYGQYHMQQQHPGFPGQQGGYNFNVNNVPQPGGYGNSPPTPHHAMGPPMLPPGGTPNSHPESMHPPVQLHSDSSSDSTMMSDRHDNGYASGPSVVTSIVTTGPDGQPMDEASQQSTLSNASVASGGEENQNPVCTPKRQREMGPIPSPRDMGPGGPNPGMLGPMGWGNRHPPGGPPLPHSPGNPPSGMNAMEEFPPTPTPPPVQNTPTPSWPRAHTSHKHDSLSKLFDMDDSVERRHYLEKLLGFMEERGSPITTCPTISKNLLDLFRLYLFVKERGGFLEVCRVNKNKIWKDIAGLLNIGASSSAAYTLRKHYIKNILPFECHFDRGGVDPAPIIAQVEASTKKKGAKAAPAPTVPSPGSSNSQDSFPSSQGGASMDGYGAYGGYPPEFNNQRPPSQPPQGYQGQNYPQYPDQYNQQYPPQPPNRAVYPYPGPDTGDRGYPPNTGPAGQTPGPYNQPGYSPRGPFPGPTPPPASPAPATQPAPPPPTPGGTQPDLYRQDAPPRRHPDFAKDAPQPPSPQSPQTGRPMYPGWSANQNNNYRGPGPGPGYPPPQQQWGPQCPPRPPASPQWVDQSRGYPTPSTPPQPGWPQNSAGGTMRHMMRPPSDPSKPFPPLPSTAGGPKTQAPPVPPGPGAVKREIQFPPDSVESVTPVVFKRRKLTRSDVAPVEAWRLMMALKSGLLAETCWAIDVLNILLFDDTGIAYFGLSHLPGLLDVILEHFKKSLSDMLETESNAPRRKWYEPPPVDTTEPDLGIPDKKPPLDKNAMQVTKCKRNFESRKKTVVTVENEDLFVKDGPRPWESFPYGTDEPESDTAYIIPPFQGEYGSVPFVRILETKGNYKPPPDTTSKPNPSVNSDVKTVVKIEPPEPPIKTEEEESVNNNKVENGETNNRNREKEKNETEEEDVKEEKFVPKLIDPTGNLKRRRLSEYEDESYCRDEASLYPVSDSQDNIARRCIALSNILRNLTFVPGNEIEFSKSPTFLRLLGRLILAYHEHGLRVTKTRNYDRDDDTDWTDCCSSLSPQAESEWWWDYMENIRENVLVSLANIAGHIDLDLYPEDITRPILDGLLHWSVCPAAQGQDPFPSSASNLSPQRLALEALCKLCVTDNNVDLVIATPPYARLERLTYVLTRFLCKNEDQVLREFGVNLLHYLAAADSAMSRTIALQSPCISLLVAFIEQAEQNALGVANQHGIGALRDNPDSMGTSLDMLRRTARTLLHLSKHPDNKPLFLQQEQRLLALVMSQILDQQVAAIISRVLYQTRPDLYQNR